MSLGVDGVHGRDPTHTKVRHDSRRQWDGHDLSQRTMALVVINTSMANRRKWRGNDSAEPNMQTKRHKNNKARGQLTEWTISWNRRFASKVRRFSGTAGVTLGGPTETYRRAFIRKNSSVPFLDLLPNAMRTDLHRPSTDPPLPPPFYDCCSHLQHTSSQLTPCCPMLSEAAHAISSSQQRQAAARTGIVRDPTPGSSISPEQGST